MLALVLILGAATTITSYSGLPRVPANFVPLAHVGSPRPRDGLPALYQRRRCWHESRTSALRRVNFNAWCNYQPLRSVAFTLIHGSQQKGPSNVRELVVRSSVNSLGT
ncbi:hypothetical protein GGI35DRAFT_279145 [Trichoderma velutinum]